jgi:hypothetical protein
VGKASRRKRRDAERAGPTTPVVAGFVEVDDIRTYLVFGAFTRSMVGATLGDAPEGLVLADLTGKWNHGAADESRPHDETRRRPRGRVTVIPPR